PIPDTRLECLYGDNAKVTATADSRGLAHVTIPDLEGSYYLNVRTSRDGLVPMVISWSRTARAPSPPDRFRLEMEKGTVVGGRVLDQDRRPVGGATVVLGVRKRYPGSEQRPNLFYVSTTSDADGRWSFANVPERPDAVEVGVYHHLYLNGEAFFNMDE